MKEIVEGLDLTEKDLQALLKDIKKRREKYRESLDYEENKIKKEDRIARKAVEEFVRSRTVLIAMK